MSMEKLKEQAFFIQRPLGVIEVTGATRLDLIDRMSTQKVRDLKAGEGAATVLTTDIGRIIDRLLVYCDKDKVFFLTGENNADTIGRYFSRYIFFNDDFHMNDVTVQTAVFAIYGAKAPEKLQQLDLPVDLPLHHWRTVTPNGVTATFHRTDSVAGAGYLLITAADQAASVHDMLAEMDITSLDENQFEQLRVESGLPLLGHELTADYIPLETQLWDDISFSKGCYIGQEIIARMESRGQLSKKLVKLEASEPVTAGVDITAAGKRVGTITSAAGSLALGYVKTSILEKEESSLTAGDIPLKVR